jgi:hypothetical protein
MPREKPGADDQRARDTVPRDPEPIRTQPAKPHGEARGREGQGLVGRDAPGKRSGEGSDSVMDQMQKDEQRNANHADGGEEPPEAARDSAP